MESDRALQSGEADSPALAEFERDDSSTKLRHNGVADLLCCATTASAKRVGIETKPHCSHFNRFEGLPRR